MNVLSHSTACRIFPDQGSNPCLLHWQPDSYTLDQKKSPLFPFEPWDPQRIHHAATLLLWLCRSPWIMSPPGEPFWSKSLLTQVKNQPHSRVRSGFPGDLVVKESACQCTSCGRCSFHPWVRKILRIHCGLSCTYSKTISIFFLRYNLFVGHILIQP